MTETIGYLGPRVTDKPFSEAEIISKLPYSVLAGFDSPFSCILLSCPNIMHFVSIQCMGSSLPKGSFAEKKTSSKWNVFSTQHSGGNKLVLPGAIVSYINRILNYLNPKL